MRAFIGSGGEWSFGYYPKWARGDGRWCYQKTSGRGKIPCLPPLEFEYRFLWVPHKHSRIGLGQASTSEQAYRAAKEIENILFLCPKCKWEGQGSSDMCWPPLQSFESPWTNKWVAHCLECFEYLEPNLCGIVTQTIIERWTAMKRPALENPCAVWWKTIPPTTDELIKDLEGWIATFEPTKYELAYVGQQLWPNFASFIKEVQKLKP